MRSWRSCSAVQIVRRSVQTEAAGVAFDGAAGNAGVADNGIDVDGAFALAFGPCEAHAGFDGWGEDVFLLGIAALRFFQLQLAEPFAGLVFAVNDAEAAQHLEDLALIGLEAAARSSSDSMMK